LKSSSKFLTPISRKAEIITQENFYSKIRLSQGIVDLNSCIKRFELTPVSSAVKPEKSSHCAKVALYRVKVRPHDNMKQNYFKNTKSI
jgi:hypothetical protein